MKVKPGNNDRHKGNKPNWHKRKVEKRAQKEKQLFEELGITDDAKETVASTSEGSANGLLGNQRKWYSLSVALPGSILNNAQSPEFRSYVAGEIARSCAIFCVDEVVIFDETARMTDSQLRSYYGDTWTASEWPSEQNVECNFHMARILEYLECPQYLRKSLYPIQKALKFAGVLNPLDGMHHLRANDSTVPYREGIVLDKPIKAGHGSLCDVGLEKDLELEDGTTLPPWTRITVRMTTRDTDKRRLRGVVTSPQVVRNESGLYWGYKVRIAKSFSDIFSKKYDVIIGTSERGTPVSDISVPRKEQAKVLVVFGGLDGIEAALESDESVSTSDPSDFFNTYINSLPDQGSRVIRTEEAIPITLAVLKPKLDSS